MLSGARSLFVVLLAVAIFAGNASQARFVRLHHATPAHDHHAVHNHEHDAGGAHHHAAAAGHDHGTTQDHHKNSSPDCCGLCIIVSTATPAAPCAAIALVQSSVLYALDESLMSGLVIVLDPGIPKRSA